MIKVYNSEINENPIKGVVQTKRLEVYSEDGSELKEFIDSKGLHRVRYRDEYVGGDWVDALGAAAPDNVAYTIGGVSLNILSFDGNNTTERKSNSFEIPHDIALDELNNESLKIELHVHFMSSTTGLGTIKWTVNYCYVPANGLPIPQNSVNILQETNGQQFFHFVKGVELPKPTSDYDIGGIILFTISRNPLDIQDTYNSDAILIKVALHIPVNEPGSKQRYIK